MIVQDKTILLKDSRRLRSLSRSAILKQYKRNNTSGRQGEVTSLIQDIGRR